MYKTQQNFSLISQKKTNLEIKAKHEDTQLLSQKQVSENSISDDQNKDYYRN